MENHYYKDKVCVVTGAASGIGLATTKLLVDEGANVYALDSKPIKMLGISGIKCDLSKKESIDYAFSNIPEKIDAFFGIAGLSGAKDDYYKTFTVNFIANKYITEEYLKNRMNEHGAICFVTSTAGNYWDKYVSEFRPYIKAKTWDKMISTLENKVQKDTVGIIAYPLSKRALNYYMSQKAVEFGNRGIRVNALLPASTRTGMIEDFEVEAGGKDELISQTGVANRFADPMEMARPLLFLNSDMASFISGVCLIADYANDAMIKLGKKRDRFDMKIGSKLFTMNIVQNKFKKKLEPLKETKEKVIIEQLEEPDTIEQLEDDIKEEELI